MDEETKRVIGDLEDAGAVEWYGMEGDEAVFKIDLEKLKDLMPALYESIVTDILINIDEKMLELWKDGHVDIIFDDEDRSIPRFIVNDNTQRNLDEL